MDIMNFGDCIKDGNYKLHSKFKSVHNYTYNNEMVSLVSTKVGTGPNNIVVNIFPQQAEQVLKIHNQTISIGNNVLNIDPKESQIIKDIYVNSLLELKYKIEILTEVISDNISPVSLGFLLFPKNETFLKTTFEKAFLDHVKKTCKSISLEKLPTVAKNMKGVGFGLTPSGDDFNCGVLYALNYLKEIINKDISERIEECFKNSIGNNLISNAFLKYAYSNKYYENFHGLLKVLKQNNKNLISHYTNKIIGSGHTSGSDMLTGFILTIKGVLNDKKFS